MPSFYFHVHLYCDDAESVQEAWEEAKENADLYETTLDDIDYEVEDDEGNEIFRYDSNKSEKHYGEK